MSNSLLPPLLRSWLALLSTTISLQAASPPNILFFFTDDHAPHAIGACNGWLKSLNPTPNIDQLAREGMLFENSFCTNSICGPSRAVILTGKHSHKNGFTDNGKTFDGSQPTFPKMLRAAGYQTALYGKWHLHSDPQGFDHWAVLPGQGLYYNPDFKTPSGNVTLQGYCTDLVTDMSIHWLRAERDPSRPFVLLCQHKAPHRNWMPALRHLDLYNDVEIPEPPTLFDSYQDNASPARHQELEIDRHMHLNFDLFVDLTPEFDGDAVQGQVDRSAWINLKRFTPEQLQVWRRAYAPQDDAFHQAKLSGRDLVRWKFQRYAKNYLRCVKGVDENFGRLRAALSELGLAENTIVIYSSDQGFYIGDHGWYDKRWMYEESLKMPLIVKWPGVTPAGVRSPLMVQNLDYAPTFLEIAGLPRPADLQGVSLVPLLRGETPKDWRKSIYYHYYEYPSVHMVPRHYGVRTERYKLMHFYQFDEWEFYDLKADPDELQNQYRNPDYAAAIASAREELARLRSLYQDGSDVQVMPEDWRRQVRGL